MRNRTPNLNIKVVKPLPPDYKVRCINNCTIFIYNLYELLEIKKKKKLFDKFKFTKLIKILISTIKNIYIKKKIIGGFIFHFIFYCVVLCSAGDIFVQTFSLKLYLLLTK